MTIVAPTPQGTTDQRPLSLLTIAGSDSGGGAGIQADLKTFAAHGMHGLSAIAALTAQNTVGVDAVHAPPESFLDTQIDALFSDFRIGATKIGMLAEQPLIAAVATAIERHRATNIVLDPVMIASSGARLLASDAVVALRSLLLPRCDVLTPNLPEAEVLLGREIRDAHAMPAAAAELRSLGARCVLLKGGHLQGDRLTDVYCDADGVRTFDHPRLAVEGHGTGCTLSSALAALLASGLDPATASERACAYVHGALKAGYCPGRGAVVVLDHFWNARLMVRA